MSDSSIRHGVQYDPDKNRSYRFTEQDCDYTEGAGEVMTTGKETNAYTEQLPTDRSAAKVTTFDGAAFLAAEQAKIPVGLATKLSLGDRLPPVLNSITAHFSKSGGTGTSDHLVGDMLIAIEDVGSGSLNPRSSAQASASIAPAVAWDIDTWQQDAQVNGLIYKLTDASGTTVAQALARLNTQLGLSGGTAILDLPVFKKKAIQLILKGQQVSLQQSADSEASISVNIPSSYSSASKNKGSSKTDERGVSIRTETTPFVIHGALTISSNTDSQGVTVTVKANIPNVPNSGTVLISAYDNEPTAASGTASASVTFVDGTNTLSATTPATIPTSRLYLVDVQTRDDEYGTVEFFLTVVDFAQYA